MVTDTVVYGLSGFSFDMIASDSIIDPYTPKNNYFPLDT